MNLSEAVPFNPQDVAIITTTQYPDWKPDIDPVANESKVRGDLALQMLDAGRELGSPLLVVDSELSSPEFGAALLERGIPVRLRTTKTLSGQRREAIAIAGKSPAEVILLNDPEKISVVTDGLEACSKPILDGNADIVIPSRDRLLFEATYPALQVIYERQQNEMINRALRMKGIMKPEHPDFDWLIGVRFMANRPEVTDLFMDEYRYKDSVREKEGVAKLLNPEMWPNGQYIPVIAALKKGLKVVGVRIPYKHPARQTEFENANEKVFKQKREDQVRNIVVGSVQGAEYQNDQDREPSQRRSIIERVVR